MKKWIVQYDAGMCGTDMAVAVLAIDEDSAVRQCSDEADDWFWNFNEDEDDDGMEPEINIWAEEYDPKKHDMLKPGGGVWEF